MAQWGKWHWIGFRVGKLALRKPSWRRGMEEQGSFIPMWLPGIKRTKRRLGISYDTQNTAPVTQILQPHSASQGDLIPTATFCLSRWPDSFSHTLPFKVFRAFQSRDTTGDQVFNTRVYRYISHSAHNRNEGISLESLIRDSFSSEVKIFDKFNTNMSSIWLHFLRYHLTKSSQFFWHY